VDKNGRDLSWYRNNNFSSSKGFFVVGAHENFYGSYWHDSKFGFGHWALYDDTPGKKIWIWALSRSGAIWEELLTNNDGQYTEPQAGRLFNQGDHEFFTPYTADLWREIWFPYKEIGPFVTASAYGAFNVTQTDDSVTLGLCPLQNLDDDLVVTADGKEVYREHLTLKPLEVYKKKLALAVEKGKLQVSVGKKLYYSDSPQAGVLHRPYSFHRPDESTAEGLYLIAQHHEKQRDYHKALTKYLACLEAEPLHIRALCRIAELYCRRAEYRKALTYTQKALENATYDPETNYLYGIISRNLGNLVDAKEALGWAARSMNYRSGAYCQLAEIYLLEGNFDLARQYCRRALDFNKYNINAYQVLAITYRKLEQPEQACRILDQLLEIDPLNHLARYELYLLEPNRKNLNNFQSMIRNELPHENYIEMALYYVKLGLDNEAVQLLKDAPEYPTVYYWLAYLLKDEKPAGSRMYLHKARSLSPRLVFPFREESIPVLRRAFETLSDDWKAKYYLGLIYWGKGRLQEARELFDDCGQPDFAPFYIARSYLRKKSDSRKTLADLEKALAVDNKDWRNWHHLVGFYNEQGLFDKVLPLAQEASQRFPDEAKLKIDLVRALMDNIRYEEARAILERTKVLPYEGAQEVHSLFVRCQIHLALESMEKGNYTQAIQYIENSKEHPEHLGTGRPYNPDFKLQERFKAICYDKMKAKSKNAAKFQITTEISELIEAMDNKK
jgi:tetratricopeptide (TPR) repeat protein